VQIPLDVVDGASHHVDEITEPLELASGDDDVGFRESELLPAAARLVVALTAASPAVERGSTRA
jgi:hypothetical protein